MEDLTEILRALPDAFALHEIVCDDSGRPVDYRFLAVNPAFERLVGLKSADIVGRTVLEILPNTEPSWIERYGHVALSGAPTEIRDYSLELDRHFFVKAFSPRPRQFATIITDVTEQARAEMTLRDQLQTIIGDTAGDPVWDLEDLLDVAWLQHLQDEIAAASGLSCLIIDPHGNEITRPSGSVELCALIRDAGHTSRCREFNLRLSADPSSRATIHRCPMSGLWSAGAHVSVAGTHVATWIIGGAMDPSTAEGAIGDVDAISALGIDMKAWQAAVCRAPAMPLRQFTNIAQAVHTIANMLSELASRNLSQARLVDESRRLAAVSRVRAELLETPDTTEKRELFSIVLEELCEMTRSPAGLFHVTGVDQDTILARAWMPRLSADHATKTIAIDADGGPFRECVSTKKALVCNDRESVDAYRTELPATHRTIDRFVLVPLVRNGRVVAMVGLANKSYDYTPIDLTTIEYLMELAWDLVEHRRTRKALLESEVQYRTIIQASPDGFWVVDAQGIILRVNEAYARMSGYALDEIPGKHVADFEAIEDADRVAARIETIMRTGSATFETRHRRRNGELWDLEVTVQTLGDLMVCFLRDISDRVRARRELELAERQLRLGQDASSSAAWQLDTGSGRFEWAPGTWTLVGLDPRQALPDLESYFSRIHHEDRDSTLEAVRLALSSEDAFEIEHRIRVDEGDSYRWVLWRGRSVEDSTGTPPYRGSIIDITDLKNAQLDVERLTAQLRALSRSARQAEELSRRALAEELHDRVSQNLAVAKMNLQIAVEENSTEGVVKAIELVGEALGETRAITAELSPHILHELGLAAALEWLVQDARRFELHGEFINECDLASVAPDVAQVVFRCVRELIANVARHAGCDEFGLSCSCADGVYRFEVADNGLGFDSEYPGAAAKTDGGFGLFSIREALNHLGGELRVRSAHGAGTEVTIRIPGSC